MSTPSLPRPRDAARPCAWPSRLLSLLPALLFLPIVFAPPVNHDVAGVLQFSQRWLAGEPLYSGLIDVNPPLIFVLNLVPAAIAAWLPINAVLALRLCLLAFGAGCWWLTFRTRDRAAEGPAERAFLDVLPALFLLGAGYDFGQREHLMVVGALPYLLASARRARDELAPSRIAVALLAGVVFALKPHFLAIPALVELAVLLARVRAGQALRRSLADPVPWLMGAVWLAYLASLPLLFPDYLYRTVPLVWGYYLDLGGMTVWQMFILPRMGAALALMVPLLFLGWRSPAMLARLLALAAFAACVAALVEHKGWSYHILPIELFSCALGALLAARWLDRNAAVAEPPRPQRIAATLAALFMLYAISNGEAPWKEFYYSNSEVAGLAALLQRAAPGGRVLVLSPGVYPIYPALNYADARSTLRSMDMWLLQGAYAQCLPNGQRYREPADMPPPERFIYQTVTEDFANDPPQAVIVDASPGIPWCGSEFSFIDYFRRDKLFATMWAQYQLLGRWGRYSVYTRGK